MRRNLLVTIAAATVLSAGASFVMLRGRTRPHAPAEFYAYSAAARGLPKLWTVPSFSYPDQRGQEITADTLRGRPWIADFIFTQCSSACPMITSRMVLMQRALPGVDVRFVSFSVDPRHDTPAVLGAYARTWNPAETRWSLLSTDAEHLPGTLAGFKVTAMASADPANPIVHSSVFLLVDADGWVRGVYDSDDDAARARLVDDARRLAPPEPGRAPVVEAGAGDLYAALGCAGCHARASVAPPLAGLFGARVKLQDGTEVTADDAYLRRSILDPAGQIVSGYGATMPSYAGPLSQAQVTALVREIEEMKSATAADQAGPVAQVTDPVCHMKIKAAPDAPSTTYRGRTLYFCSDRCKDAFLADPAKYAPSADAPRAASARR